MVINKDLTGDTPLTLDITNFKAAGTAHEFQLIANAIVERPDQSFNGSKLALTVPPQSITLFVLPAQGRTSPAPPVAAMTATPAGPYAPPPSANAFTFPVTFNGGKSTPGAAAIKSYFWDFGDGASATGAGPPAHDYASYGLFTASLTVTDANGLAGTATRIVSVEPRPLAGFSCAVGYALTDYGTTFLSNFTIQNTSKQAINGWVLTWGWPGAQTIASDWNATFTQAGKEVAAVNVNFNGMIGAGQTLISSWEPGIFGNDNGPDAAPTGFILNGTACRAG